MQVDLALFCFFKETNIWGQFWRAIAFQALINSGRQEALRILLQQLQMLKRLRPLTLLNCAIELAFDIQRHWINYQFPRYLMSQGILQMIFSERTTCLCCDYSYFASLVECYFMAPYVIPMDEYGLPIPISKKIGDIIEISSNMDDALKQLS